MELRHERLPVPVEYHTQKHGDRQRDAGRTEPADDHKDDRPKRDVHAVLSDRQGRSAHSGRVHGEKQEPVRCGGEGRDGFKHRQRGRAAAVGAGTAGDARGADSHDRRGRTGTGGRDRREHGPAEAWKAVPDPAAGIRNGDHGANHDAELPGQGAPAGSCAGDAGEQPDGSDKDHRGRDQGRKRRTRRADKHQTKQGRSCMV